jgi:hypothetical protein
LTQNKVEKENKDKDKVKVKEHSQCITLLLAYINPIKAMDRRGMENKSRVG